MQFTQGQIKPVMLRLHVKFWGVTEDCSVSSIDLRGMVRWLYTWFKWKGKAPKPAKVVLWCLSLIFFSQMTDFIYLVKYKLSLYWVWMGIYLPNIGCLKPYLKTIPKWMRLWGFYSPLWINGLQCLPSDFFSRCK